MLTGETTGQVLSCEINFSEVLMLLSETESHTRSGGYGKPAFGPRAVVDPVHVETSSVRNLGDLTATSADYGRGRFIKEESSR